MPRTARAASDRALYATCRSPSDWVDQTTGGEPTLFIGQGDQRRERRSGSSSSGTRRSSGSGAWTAARPGGVTPNLLRPDGTQDPADLGAEYAVVVEGRADRRAPGDDGRRLRRVPPRRQAGAAARDDHRRRRRTAGWARRRSYTRYDVDGPRRGFVKVALSRTAACFPQLKPADRDGEGRPGRGERVRPARDRHA